MVCVCVLYWCMCICMCTHGGIPYFSIDKRYQLENATNFVILEGRENMGPLFDSVTVVGIDIGRFFFSFMFLLKRGQFFSLHLIHFKHVRHGVHENPLSGVFSFPLPTMMLPYTYVFSIYQHDVINRDPLSTRRYQQKPLIKMVDTW